MARKLLVFDRSPLARNVYLMILSSIDEINLVSGDVSESIDRVKEDVRKSDLTIFSHSTLGEKKDEYCRMLAELYKEKFIPCVFLVGRGSKASWEVFSKLKGVEVIERPFFPDDLLNAVGKLWGAK